MPKRTVEKTYIALLERTPKTLTGRIEVPLARDPNNRRKMAALRTGRPAISEYQVVERFEDGKALVQVKLLTGRTHQIRVHMAYMGCPLVGDALYGFHKQTILRGQFLHAWKSVF